MTFARDEIRRQVAGLSRRQLVWHQTVTAQTCFMVARALVNPEIYRAVFAKQRARYVRLRVDRRSTLFAERVSVYAE